jgi:hypothetical protein
MNLYRILDEETKEQVGILLYYPNEKSWVVELADHLDEWTAPLLFTAFVKKGIYTIPRDFSLLWVKERLIPSGRQNIQSILKQHRLKEYDECKFLELSKGKCSQDSLYIEKTDLLPEYVRKRQEKNLREATILPADRLLLFFNNGETKILSREGLLQLPEMDKVLANKSLMSTGMIRADGYCFSFNNSIDLPSGTLFEAGHPVPLTLEDFTVFIQENIYDSGQACERLVCSRQNLSYLVKENRISPLRKKVGGSLFLKNDIDRMMKD